MMTDNASLSSEFSNSQDSNQTEGSERNEQNRELGNRNDDDNQPYELVREEDRAIRYARTVVFVVLLLATITTAGFAFFYVANQENGRFRSDFEAVSDMIVESMTRDIYQIVWGARTIAKSVQSVMNATGASHTNLTVPEFKGITGQALIIAGHNLISWSPILFTDSERAEFESYAERTLQLESESAVPLACYFCDNPTYGFVNREASVDIKQIGVRSCGDYDDAARSNKIREADCIMLKDILNDVCICSTERIYEDANQNQDAQIDSIVRLEDGQIIEETQQGILSPMWQVESLGTRKDPVLWNQMSDPVRASALFSMLENGIPVFSETFVREGDYANIYSGDLGDPAVALFYPVSNNRNEIVGSVTAELSWRELAKGILPPNSEKVRVVVENSCGQSYSFSVDKERNELSFIGEGNLHDERYDDMAHSSSLEDFDYIVRLGAGLAEDGVQYDYCRYRFLVYATSAMEEEYRTKNPIIISAMVVTIFLFTALVFVAYDSLVVRRQQKVMEAATRSAALVSTLFPRQVVNRLYEQGGQINADNNSAANNRSGTSLFSGKTRLRRFLDNAHDGQTTDTEPIADLFPCATVMFLDLEGFTAWSSERDPTQVFKLLEMIYNSFDRIAKRLGVFKVETIGDSYLAVAGLPEPREDHAVVMAKFAMACMRRMARLTKDLVSTLGPSTGDLKARCGLHSGPVTAGVLRGDKARFQLFGDTVNTASRMESKGLPDKIQASQQTVDLLRAAGKSSWYIPREDLVSAKGKGELQTYWIIPKKSGAMSTTSQTSSLSTSETRGDNRGPQQSIQSSPGHVNYRLVNWNVEFLYALLENLVRQRSPGMARRNSLTLSRRPLEVEFALQPKRTAFDEMVEVVQLPEFRAPTIGASAPPIDRVVKDQLREFVTRIAALYRDVPFHNFEHASHVTMSAGKLMKRILRPDGVDEDPATASNTAAGGGGAGGSGSDAVAKKIHDMTYGLSSDPLTQFAIVFSALIHDVDHTGLPNTQLIKMKTPTALAYANKSVAEQNSVDVAWDVLMDDGYKELRNCIYRSEDEKKRFRQVVVNSVMATDIADKELLLMRKKRWEIAFKDDGGTVVTTTTQMVSSSNGGGGSGDDNNGVVMAAAVEEASKQQQQQSSSMDMNRKATIVFEYIIQASDVAHTMQHWHIYRRWNERLFEECYAAWINGQADKDPTSGWYNGELSFFDNYVIPLAERLAECGVFGVSYHESLHYAMENRKEWEVKGKEIVETMTLKCQQTFAAGLPDNDGDNDMIDEQLPGVASF